mmetsp:Transcript_3355/g.7339  ORF Transcript_3355/g.7339 Transcript_3355/m.7339 type:complete len:83 (+) Transcript_3355:67-315(+)
MTLYLPVHFTQIVEELAIQSREEAFIVQLEKEVESKNLSIRDWQKNKLPIGRAQSSTQEVHQDLEEEDDAGDADAVASGEQQ